MPEIVDVGTYDTGKAACEQRSVSAPAGSSVYNIVNLGPDETAFIVASRAYISRVAEEQKANGAGARIKAAIALNEANLRAQFPGWLWDIIQANHAELLRSGAISVKVITSDE